MNKYESLVTRKKQLEERIGKARVLVLNHENSDKIDRIYSHGAIRESNSHYRGYLILRIASGTEATAANYGEFKPEGKFADRMIDLITEQINLWSDELSGILKKIAAIEELLSEA
jgi:hypothetical protein